MNNSDKKPINKSSGGSDDKKATPFAIIKKNKKNSLNRYKKPLETNPNLPQHCGCEICTNEDKHKEIAEYSKTQELFLILYSILKKRSTQDNFDPQNVKANYVCNNDYKPFVQNHPILNNKLKYKMATQIFCSSPYFTNSQRDGLTKFGHKFGLPAPIDTIDPWLPLNEQQKHSYLSKKVQNKEKEREKELKQTKPETKDDNKPTPTTTTKPSSVKSKKQESSDSSSDSSSSEEEQENTKKKQVEKSSTKPKKQESESESDSSSSSEEEKKQIKKSSSKKRKIESSDSSDSSDSSSEEEKKKKKKK